MAFISAVIITYNEEKNIERCLKSVLKVADEIVILDSFSTDRTKEICQNYATKFLTHKFEGYRQQKNLAVAQASHNWVLSLDADEALSLELERSILEIKDSPGYDGYFVNRLNRYCGTWIRHSNWYPDRKLRLFNRTKGEWKGTNPHDRYIMNSGAKTGRLKGDLLHFVIDSYEAHIEKANNFSSIAAKEYYKMGKKTNPLSMTFRMIWRFLKAYVFKRGFLDGYNGFVISSLSAYTSFLKYLKLRQLYLNDNGKKKRRQKEINIAGEDLNQNNNL
jgi:glycosyltransferase involved in cell wall biosynthesis